jgi:hypothetical protein
LKGYRIYRALFIERIGDGAFLAEVPAGTRSYTDTVYGADFFYTVRAVDNSGIESSNSMLVQSKVDTVYVALADDKEARVVLEPESARDLQAGLNGRGEDLLVQVKRRAAEEGGKVLRSYELEVRGAASNQKIDRFFFHKPVTVAFAVNPPGASAPARPVLQTAPSLAPDQMSIYWFNGVELVKLGGVYDSQNNVIAVASQRPGVYRLMAALQAAAFEVVQLWPQKIFTPNGDGVNDEINFVYNNPKGVPVSGEIYDVYGARVADLRAGRDGSSLVWDGRDAEGETVAKGVYIYQIKGDGKMSNGTVVVAR